MGRNLLLLTPVYPADDAHKSTTPVVHYFTREWVKMGYNVRVIHYSVNFPWFVNLLAKPFKNIIGSRIGSEIRTWRQKERKYELEGVYVYRIPLTKLMPHARYTERTIVQAVDKTISYCSLVGFTPDVILCHWVNPTLDIVCRLKRYYRVPACYVAHDSGRDLMTIYSGDARTLLDSIDVVGYRSCHIREVMEERFSLKYKPHFMCYSGIPEEFLRGEERSMDGIRSFIFVGTLLKRKYPAEILLAVNSIFADEEFVITYVGDGFERKNIERYARLFDIERNIHLLGRVPREEVVSLLDKHEVFVMISRGETFGLVYLEAMARGCITIAARNQGFDGIIEDGRNGFLCEAGNVKELTAIIAKLKNMNAPELSAISCAAMNTARKLTDTMVAKNYIKTIENALS